MSTPKNRTTLQNIDQSLIEGVTKHQATLPTLIIGGTPYTPPEIIARLKKRIDSGGSVVAAKAAYQAAVKADRDERARSKAFVSGLEQALRIAFATAIATLADFGLKPRKAPTPLTAERKAEAKLKAEATRKARHTMSAKAKAKIKGATVAPTAPADPANGGAGGHVATVTTTTTVAQTPQSNGAAAPHG